MNLELLESFGQNYPEDFDGALDCVSIAVACSFNRRGTLLAVGCNDGRIVVWDFLTRGITKILNAHVHPVCSLSWNRNGRKLLSASTDNVVSIWDVLTGDCDRSFRFPAPVLKVQFHPRDSGRFIVCPIKHAAILMKLDGTHKNIPLDEDSDLNIVASFDRRGDYIYSGNAKGKIIVLKTEGLLHVASFKVTTGSSSTTVIKSIEFARRGNWFLVNSADRIIRVYDTGEVLTCGKEGEPEPVQKLQDLVNKTLWKKCQFSGDGEYVVAGSARSHSLYIWENSSGNLAKILHGRKGELLLDVVWHPVRPIIASVSSGIVSIWAQNQVENWSAFAPDFKELDENIEYEERESEFDIEDEDKETEEARGPDVEDEDVDVQSNEPIVAFMSSDEEEEDNDALLFLPVAPEFEEDEGWEDDQITPEKRKHSTSKEQSKDSPVKKKSKPAVDIDLPNAPKDEIHPWLMQKKTNDKPKNTKTLSKPKSSSKHKSDSKTKHKDKSKDSSREYNLME